MAGWGGGGGICVRASVYIVIVKYFSCINLSGF